MAVVITARRPPADKLVLLLGTVFVVVLNGVFFTKLAELSLAVLRGELPAVEDSEDELFVSSVPPFLISTIDDGDDVAGALDGLDGGGGGPNGGAGASVRRRAPGAGRRFQRGDDLPGSLLGKRVHDRHDVGAHGKAAGARKGAHVAGGPDKHKTSNKSPNRHAP